MKDRGPGQLAPEPAFDVHAREVQRQVGQVLGVRLEEGGSGRLDEDRASGAQRGRP